ncbi:hypothetical protein [Streptomyces sp. NPDC058683]
MYRDLLNVGINPVPMALVRAGALSPCMRVRTYAFRAWFSQIRFTHTT